MLLQATLALSKPPMDGEFLPEGSVLDLESVRISLIYGRLSQLLPSYYYTPSCCRHASISCRRRTRATRYLTLPMLTFGKVTSKNVIVLYTFSVFLQCVGQAHKCTRYHVLACNLVKYSSIKQNSTHRLSNKPVLIWLLSTPPHLKHVATLS